MEDSLPIAENAVIIMQNYALILFAAGFGLLIAEIFTPTTFFFFSLSVSSFLTGIISYVLYFFKIKSLNMLIVFYCIFAIITFIFMRKIKWSKNTSESLTNKDNYAGKTVVIKQILGHDLYRVRIFGEEWNATSKEEFSVDEEAEIIELKGNTFTIKKKI